MNRFLPVFRRGTRTPGVIVMTDNGGKFHARPEYTDIELAGLCRWLNERDKGYPTRIYVIDFDEKLQKLERTD